MINNEQKELIDKRILMTLKIFYENEGKVSDEVLARLVSMAGIVTSSSTVGRDLTGKRIRELITEEEYYKIQQIRKINKKYGNIKGGKKSALVNDIEKDKHGHFNGCKKR